MRSRFPFLRLFGDRRGVAAAEFALIAPALIFLIMGVLEMSFRFRASEEATRYVHQVADIVSRETDLQQADLKELFDASIFMMKPLDTTDDLDLDISSVGFVGTDETPTILWRRIAGTEVYFDLADTEGMGIGLYISRNVLARHHGRLMFDSPGEGKGSTFSFAVPVV